MIKNGKQSGDGGDGDSDAFANSIYSLCPIDGRYREKIDPPIRELLSEFGLIKKRLQVEVEWVIHQHPELSADSRAQLRALYSTVSSHNIIEIKTIEKKINHDVKAVETYLATRMQPSFASLIPSIHFCLTSEDVNNLAYALIFSDVRTLLMAKIDTLQQQFVQLAHQHHDAYMISRTHGQAATPTSFGKEMAVFADRIKKTAEHFAGLPLYGKCNGASGCYATFSLFESDPATAIAKNDDFIQKLGLTPIQLTTQIAPADDLASYLHALVRLASILKDASVDFWLYCSQNYLALKVVDEEVGSSTMPHKVNPINFENAEGNLSIAISLASGLATQITTSRLQRDLSGSTRMRNIGLAIGYLIVATESLVAGMQKITVAKKVLADELDQHWELLAEAIQTALRKKGVADAYEQLKADTRGKTITKQDVHNIIERHGLGQSLATLTPARYHGFASHLARLINANPADDEPGEKE